MIPDPMWSPRCERPADLVRPVRVDPSGVTGPTRGQAQRGRWRQTSRGWHVPVGVDGTRVEQRILEQGMRLRTQGAVTAWAALRWRGAHYFDGIDGPDGPPLPVPLIRPPGGHRVDDPAALCRRALPPYDRQFVAGLWVTTPLRAVFDEVRRIGHLRSAVVAVCMTMAAGLVTTEELDDYATRRTAWEGVPLFRETLTLTRAGFRSPPEVRMWLRWVLDAGLPEPLINRPVFDLGGRLLGFPDLFDPVAGVVGEYNGEIHKSRERARRDVDREERFRRHGLEVFTVVAGDSASVVVDRMIAARRRARFLPPEERSWTMEPPPGWAPPAWAA